MADRPKVTNETGLQTAGTQSFEFGRVPQVSTSDTVTITDFTTVSAISMYHGDTGVALTTTISGNVVTVTTAALTNIKAYYLAVGVR